MDIHWTQTHTTKYSKLQKIIEKTSAIFTIWLLTANFPYDYLCIIFLGLLESFFKTLVVGGGGGCWYVHGRQKYIIFHNYSYHPVLLEPTLNVLESLQVPFYRL